MKLRIASMILALLTVIPLTLNVSSVGADAESTLPFTDVKNKSWFYPYVERVYDEGLMKGLTETLFYPNDDMTRAQLVTVLYRLAAPAEGVLHIESSFSDVKAGAWYSSYIAWALSEGLVSGYPDGTFRPDKSVSRQEIAKLLAEFIEYLGIDANSGTALTVSFNDADTFPKWAEMYIEKIRVAGLIGGDTKGNFNPKQSATRAEIATILTRFSDIPRCEISPDGTELHYFGVLEEDAFNEWLAEIAADKTGFSSASVKDFESIVEHYESLGKSDFLRREIDVVFSDTDGHTEERTYLLIMQEPTAEEDDATADNIGVEYEDPETGIKFSYLRLIEDEDGVMIPSCGYGLHGGHEIRIVRTENGTYATYLINEVIGATDEHPYWFQGTATAGVIKITSNGFKLLYSFEYPLSQSSHTPNILRGKNGMVYVVNIADDHDKYMKSLELAQTMGNIDLLCGGAWLDMYELDTNTDTVTLTDSCRPDFDTHPTEDLGYGKSNPIMDVEHGRIIALFNGGDVPGYFAWFVYDMNTKSWDTDCKTIKLDRRRDYINGYPDGNGGFSFVIQTVGTVASREEQDGIKFTVADGYLWDGLYIFNIPDPYVEECKAVEICSAVYSTTEVNKPQAVTHYGYGGGTYRDFDGNIHVLYTHSKSGGSTIYHAIYDSELRELYNDKISFTAKNGSYSNTYSLGMTQGPSGKYYIVAMYCSGNTKANFEIWSSDDGISFTNVVERHELKTVDGETVAKNKIVIANSRSNSIIDGNVPLLINGDNCYYNIVLTLP